MCVQMYVTCRMVNSSEQKPVKNSILSECKKGLGQHWKC